MHARGIRKRTDGYDPGESRILLNIARALNFLPIKPPASLPAFSLPFSLSLSVPLVLDRARSLTPPPLSATPFLRPFSLSHDPRSLSPSLSLSLSLVYIAHLPPLRILSGVFLPGFQAG